MKICYHHRTSRIGWMLLLTDLYAVHEWQLPVPEPGNGILLWITAGIRVYMYMQEEDEADACFEQHVSRRAWQC